MKSYIGIDVGLDGGIVTLDSAGNIIDQRVMPTIKLGKGRKIDLAGLDHFLSFEALRFKQMADFSQQGLQSTKSDLPTVIIEDPGGHAPSAAGLRSMTYSFAACESLCVAHGLRYHLVRAQAWQKEFWSKPASMKGKKFDTKAAALNVANQLWPGNEWRQVGKSGKLLKNPADGVVDSALIAEFGRRKNL